MKIEAAYSPSSTIIRTIPGKGRGAPKKPGAVRVMQLVSIVFIVFLLAMLAWPSVEPRLNSLLHRRSRRRRRGYFRD